MGEATHTTLKAPNPRPPRRRCHPPMELPGYPAVYVPIPVPASVGDRRRPSANPNGH